MDQELIARSMRKLAREFDSCRNMLVAPSSKRHALAIALGLARPGAS